MRKSDNLQNEQSKKPKQTDSLIAFIEIYKKNREEKESSYNQKFNLKRIKNGKRNGN